MNLKIAKSLDRMGPATARAVGAIVEVLEVR